MEKLKKNYLDSFLSQFGWRELFVFNLINPAWKQILKIYKWQTLKIFVNISI